MFAIIQAAGWPIWPLLLASIIAVALIIERAITLQRGRIVPPTLLEQVIAVYHRQGASPEVLTRLAKDSPLGTVLAAALRNHHSPRHVMKEAVEEAGQSVALVRCSQSVCNENRNTPPLKLTRRTHANENT